MNLLFRQTADPHSLDILRGNARVGSLQWHPEREPRVVVDLTFHSFTQDELREMSAKLGEMTRTNRTRHEAVGVVLTALRNRLALVSRPQREEALELSKKYEITAVDLVEYAVEQVKRNS